MVIEVDEVPIFTFCKCLCTLLTLMLLFRLDCVRSINTCRFVVFDVLGWLIGSSGSNLVVERPNEKPVSNGIDISFLIICIIVNNFPLKNSERPLVVNSFVH